MSTIIVFSKDRPMQLHGYLESLLWASECREEQTYVLYREVLPICYDKVKTYFPRVHWIAETNFVEQLQEIIAIADEYIMFGCDDVVFVDRFKLEKMETYLQDHESVFGFSLRLGRNIKPMPKKVNRDGEFCVWKWTDSKGHYGYPWELDCTMYRKADVIKIIGKIGTGNIKSPNYLEAIPEDNPMEFVSRENLVSYYDKSKAIVITVNRVQETHQNGVDSSKMTDVLSLFIEYQYEDRILDLNSIAKYGHYRVHVGSEYFQLTPSVLEESGKKRTAKWHTLLHNLWILKNENIEILLRNIQNASMLGAQLQCMAFSAKKPVVLSPVESVRRIREKGKSFCRFGDGEFTIMLGGNIGFQKYDPQLALRLWEIFYQQDESIDIGIPYQQFQLPGEFNEWIREFYYTSGEWVRAFLNRYLPKGREIYLDTGFNQVYQTYSSMNFAAYYEDVCELFRGRKLTVIVGDKVLDKLRYNVFDYAESVEYIYGPAKDAYQCYEAILEQALKIEYDRIICVILGPVSKVLVEDLTKAGYTAWDVGHLAKDYDAYRKRLNRTKEDIGRFYAPD